MRSKKSFFHIVIIPFILGILFVTFIIQCSIVSGSSMKPTFKDGEHIVLKKIQKHYRRGDVVVVKHKQLLLKRIVGIPGDTIEFKNNKIYINQRIPTFYNYTGISDKNHSIIKLGQDEYFIIGDHFQASYDSRSFGPIQKEQIVGNVISKF